MASLPTPIPVQNLQGKCPQIAGVFYFHVATVWPPRLTLVQLDLMVQTVPDCPVLETGRCFPFCQGLGFIFPRVLSKSCMFTKSQAPSFLPVRAGGEVGT